MVSNVMIMYVRVMHACYRMECKGNARLDINVRARHHIMTRHLSTMDI
jgi:hypothetical protein